MGVEDGCWGWVHFKTRIFLPNNVRSSCVIVKTSANWSLFFGNDISWAFVVSMGFCSVFSSQDLLMSAIVLFHRSHSAAMCDPRISISQGPRSQRGWLNQHTGPEDVLARLLRLPDWHARHDGVTRLGSGTKLSNRKNPGNTKYVFDGHWFMEIDGNC